MIEKLKLNIINVYSQIHTLVSYNNNSSISFDGSQRQIEFFTAWDRITQFYENKKIDKLKFLEVGAWKGLWGLAFTEFCKLYNIKGEYTTITLIDHDPNNIPLYNTINYNKSQGIKSNLIDMNTFDKNALSEVKKYGESFNIVFIDAGHKYHEAINDINKFSSLATDLLLFHDIRPITATNDCGVYQAIQDSNIKLDEEISTSNAEMGIGIKYIK